MRKDQSLGAWQRSSYRLTQPPVSTALILLGGSNAEFLMRNSWSSLVKMSFVTTPILSLSLNLLQMASVSAVFPLPTGPPCPTVKALSSQLRREKSGRSRSPNFPG